MYFPWFMNVDRWNVWGSVSAKLLKLLKLFRNSWLNNRTRDSTAALAARRQNTEGRPENKIEKTFYLGAISELLPEPWDQRMCGRKSELRQREKIILPICWKIFTNAVKSLNDSVYTSTLYCTSLILAWWGRARLWTACGWLSSWWCHWPRWPWRRRGCRRLSWCPGILRGSLNYIWYSWLIFFM